jgi:lysophospholipase L1-like esterase
VAATVNVTFLGCVGNCKYFIESFVDCVSQGTTEISESANSNVVVTVQGDGSGTTVSQVKFVKRTEPSCADAEGVMVIGDILVIGGGLGKRAKSEVKSCSTGDRNLIFIGDSITSAYGIDGVAPCGFTAATENYLHGYGKVIADLMNANAHIISWSGIGVVRNYLDEKQLSETPMPVYYNRTIPIEASSYWNPSQFKPDAVYVQLGTNDFSLPNPPTAEQFQSGYTTFINRIRTDYPGAKIMIACAAMKVDGMCENIEATANANNVAYLDVPSSTIENDIACDVHPSAQGHVNMANVIAPALEALLASK